MNHDGRGVESCGLVGCPHANVRPGASFSAALGRTLTGNDIPAPREQRQLVEPALTVNQGTPGWPQAAVRSQHFVSNWPTWLSG
jgi:hypothetical protein